MANAEMDWGEDYDNFFQRYNFLDPMSEFRDK